MLHSKVIVNMSQFMNTYGSYLTHFELNNNMVKENFDFYKKLSDFKQVDVSICSFPVSMCEAFIPLNKTIIFNPAWRYNMLRCTQRSWLKLNENYFKLKNRNKLIVSSMSRYDEEYQAHFTGLRGYRIFAYGLKREYEYIIKFLFN
jgi:hypothetical protein